MLRLSDNPDDAQEQMSALIFYLVTFGCIDGFLAPAEMAFIKKVLHELIEDRVDHPPEGAVVVDREELLEQYKGYFDKLLEMAEQEIKDLSHEVVAEAESQQHFVTSRLRQRCFEAFLTFENEQQKDLLETLEQLLWADGEAHPAEVELRASLLALLDVDAPSIPEMEAYPKEHALVTLDALPHEPSAHPWFTPLEQPFPAETPALAKALALEQETLYAVQTLLHQQRRLGEGRLGDRVKVDDLMSFGPFLDAGVWWLPPQPDRTYELTVVGDLHGCYSCFKAAVLQSRFFERLEAFRRNPHTEPEPKMIFLGDYLDRGRFGFEGVLRGVLQLMTAAPDHVYVLRGNHEHLEEDDHGERVDSAVRPAESIDGLRKIAPVSLQRSYAKTFRQLPHVLLFGRILFTHGGIPADGVIETNLRTLSSMCDPLSAFQMRWSDPSAADVIPRTLQAESYRFGFGRLQARAFLHRFGCHTLLRGHEKIEAGYERKVSDPYVEIYTLFSAGGETNEDLPADSSYRGVTPMALTIRHEGGLDGRSRFEIWPLDYAPYNTAAFNAFYADEK